MILFNLILGDLIESSNLFISIILLELKELKESIFKALLLFELLEIFKFLLKLFFSLRFIILSKLNFLIFNSFGLKLDNLILNLFLCGFFIVLFISLLSWLFTNKVKCKGKSITFFELLLLLFFTKGKNSFLIFLFLFE